MTADFMCDNPGQFDSNATPSLEPVAALVDPSAKVVLLSNSSCFPGEKKAKGYKTQVMNIL